MPKICKWKLGLAVLLQRLFRKLLQSDGLWKWRTVTLITSKTAAFDSLTCKQISHRKCERLQKIMDEYAWWGFMNYTS